MNSQKSKGQKYVYFCSYNCVRDKDIKGYQGKSFYGYHSVRFDNKPTFGELTEKFVREINESKLIKGNKDDWKIMFKSINRVDVTS